ncbi:hypothetical protein PybrP1_006976 [[Pythium] brassicae (nom. inval.)]|nr:hypothetical protein PybrP1_006976 [[Pythium] brassicae (nom. inval.)]
MNVIYSVKDYVSNVLDFHHGAVSGAIDIVAVQHEDGSFRCTPFHVHFGKSKLKRVKEKVVSIVVNGHVVPGVHMKLGAAGEAFFVEEADEPVNSDYNTSPLGSPVQPLMAATSDGGPLQSGPKYPSVHFDLRSDSLSPSSSYTSSPSGSSVGEDFGDSPEWHDAYRRLAPELQTQSQRRDDSHITASERLTWGWGALPVVQPAADLMNSGDTDTEDELPMMVKSESVYFDAIEPETGATGAHFADHPCMSLCGHLLDDAECEEDAHAIFSEHIITFEHFRENPIGILGDRNLMFLIDGRICPFSPEIQASFVARVLFPNSPPLPQLSDDEHLAQEWEHDDEHAATGVQIDTAFGRESLSTTLSSSSLSELQTSDDAASESYHRKSLQPSQADLLKMELRNGANDIDFVVHAASGPELRVSARLYYWPTSAKIVIAEIDGAVSRIASSGMFSNLLSSKAKARSGLHHGALEFYSKLARNGYHVVYLTCRGLSQAELMHAMLRPHAEKGPALPNGPVLLAPDRLLATDSNEVIEARDFKVAALSAIRALFPSDVNPFYAAFGRTFADSVVFTQVGVFPGKVFLVDEGDGRLRHKSMMNFQESYSSLLAMLDKMFPPLCSLSPRGSLTGSSDSAPTTTAMMPQPHQERIQSAPSSSTAVTSAAAVASMRCVYSVADDLVSEVISSQARTRSLGDEAYNDLNFWKIRPGRI